MTRLSDLVRPGRRVAIADGAGCPTGVLAELSAAARRVGRVELVLGWTPADPSASGLDLDAFASVRRLVGDDAPFRYGAVPALLAGPLKPDVLVASVCPGAPWFLTEVGWLRAAVDAGAVVAAVERDAVPVLDRGPILAPERVRVIGSDDVPPAAVRWPEPDDADRAVAERVAGLVPTGARLRYDPGPVGTAVLDALHHRVRIDTGVITDAVLGLDRRGLLVGRPLAPYVAGSEELYGWADGRVDADRVEVTHDPVRLAGAPLVSVTGALQVDHDGQVVVAAPASCGGVADHAAAAARSVGGLSIVALPTTRNRRSTLVDRLPAPVTIPAHDVDVVVTERGIADLRGSSRAERRRAIDGLWGE